MGFVVTPVMVIYCSSSLSLSPQPLSVCLSVSLSGETLHMSQQKKSPIWIQSPKETSRV